MNQVIHYQGLWLRMKGGCVAWLCCILLACASTPSPPTDAIPQVDARLSSGYSLLHDLVMKQRGVDKILLIKSVSDPTADLIREIAQLSGQAQNRIKAYADEDDHIGLDRSALPQIEQATRDAIESATAKRLLFISPWFELDLLLTQYEATKYGGFLARQLAKLDPSEARRQWLDQFSEGYQRQHERVVARLGQLVESQ